MTDTVTTVHAEVFLGVDTHNDTHHAAVIDPLGRPIADRGFPTGEQGYRQLLTWACGHGRIGLAGVECTGSYGAGLTRVLTGAGITVREVRAPERATRRRKGKNDTLDAYSAARAVLSGTAEVVPKTRDGDVEAIRVLHTVRASGVDARKDALNQLKSLIVSSPETLRARLRGLTRARLLTTLTTTDTTADVGDIGDIGAVTVIALASLARRILALDEEITALDTRLRALTRRAAPQLTALLGVGTEVAAQLLTTIGDNPERFTSEAAFARLCGVAPLEASSGQTIRHRLNRGGDRQANRALHTIVLTRLAHDPQTRAYMHRRTTQDGKTKREVIRCLKRYTAREIYRILKPRPLDNT